MSIPLGHTLKRLPFWRNILNCYRINRRAGQRRWLAFRTALEVAEIIESVRKDAPPKDPDTPEARATLYLNRAEEFERVARHWRNEGDKITARLRAEHRAARLVERAELREGLHRTLHVPGEGGPSTPPQEER